MAVLEEGGGVRLAPWCLGGGGGMRVIAPPPPSACNKGNSLGNLGSINDVDFALWSMKNICKKIGLDISYLLSRKKMKNAKFKSQILESKK